MLDQKRIEEALLQAVKSNNLTKLNALLENLQGKPLFYFYLSCRDEQHRTLLHIAANEGYDKILSRLLKIQELERFLIDADGKTPLQLAIDQQRTECIRVLLEHGAGIRIILQGSLPKELNTSDLMLIDSTYKDQTIARSHDNFQHAITSVIELEEALSNGVTLPLPEIRVSCEQLKMFLPEDEVLGQVIEMLDLHLVSSPALAA